MDNNKKPSEPSEAERWALKMCRQHSSLQNYPIGKA